MKTRNHMVSVMSSLMIFVSLVLADEKQKPSPEDTKPPVADREVAESTKDTPFMNSLGMKFVPVHVADGPSKDKKVLFCVWETRRRDYAAFANENGGMGWKWKDSEFKGQSVGHGNDHPVVCVSWEDAVAFCHWLTEREHKTGKIPASAEYRLPTDYEWSCAVGIGPLEQASKPATRQKSIKNKYPWGEVWPPPKNTGNYAGKELISTFDWRGAVIDDYEDGYATTAPVGSFPPNNLGLYDLDGNVTEWCEDLAEFGGSLTPRVMRGGSWISNDRALLKSSYRAQNPPNIRDDPCCGFRCVLVIPNVVHGDVKQ